MSLSLPEGIDRAMLAGLSGQGGPPPPLPDQGPPPPLPQGLQDEPGPELDPLGCLKDVIDGFPRLLTELQDPKDVQDAVKALQTLAGIQTRLMSAGGPQPQG